MGKQKGVVILSGTLDNINFYISKGQALTRKAGGGFTSLRVKTDPKMVRVRENSGEFGDASRAKKLFGIGLRPFLLQVKCREMQGRIMSLFQQIKACDTVSERGKRQVGIGLASSKGQLLLKQFKMTEREVGTTLLANCVFDAGSSTFTVSDFDIQRVVFPKGATGMEVLFGVVVLDYEAMDSYSFMSAPQFLDASFLGSGFVMVPAHLPTVAGISVAVAGVRFYQDVGGERYLFKALDQLAVTIVAVY